VPRLEGPSQGRGAWTGQPCPRWWHQRGSLAVFVFSCHCPETDFKTYLTKYVDATDAKNATTIFVTPPPRHSCNAGENGVRNGLAAYATAMKELGPTLGAPVVDLNAMTIAYLACLERTRRLRSCVSHASPEIMRIQEDRSG
jgi:hypothetical protein